MRPAILAFGFGLLALSILVTGDKIAASLESVCPTGDEPQYMTET